MKKKRFTEEQIALRPSSAKPAAMTDNVGYSGARRSLTETAPRSYLTT